MEQQVNLYQPILGAQQRMFSARTIAGALLLVVVSLIGIWQFSGWRLRIAERSLAALESREAASTQATSRGLNALHAGGSLETLEADARKAAADIADREKMIAIIQRGTTDVSDGFAARLEGLAHQQLDGLWLRRIILASGGSGGGLALAGSANDAQLVARYLGGLSREPTLGAARIRNLQMRRPQAGEGAGATVFEVGDIPAETKERLR